MGIKLGMIGLGAFGAGFANLFMAHPDIDSIALCDEVLDVPDFGNA